MGWNLRLDELATIAKLARRLVAKVQEELATGLAENRKQKNKSLPFSSPPSWPSDSFITG